jgi:hypothetical protein
MPLIVRERLHLIPGILWLNFSRRGYTSTTVHLFLASWNSKIGWTLHVGHGVSYRFPHRKHPDLRRRGPANRTRRTR